MLAVEVTLDTGLGAVATLLALVGLVVALKEGNELRRTRRQLREAIAEVRGELSTRYLGEFPQFLPHIIAVLKEARESISVFCDFLPYGLITDPTTYEEYVRTLRERAEAGVEVRVVYMGTKRLDKVLKSQYCGENWDATRERPELASFVETHGAELASIDEDGLLKLLKEANSKARRDHFKGLTKEPTEHPMPLLFWIVDGRKAVFAFTRFSREAREVGFSTESDNLVRSLKAIFAGYFG